MSLFLDTAPELGAHLTYPDFLYQWARNRVLAGDIEDLDSDAINQLTRGCLHARPGYALTVVDFSAIEARVIAWGAGDQDALALFRDGKCPYRAVASRVFGVPAESIAKASPMRDLGKRIELGCGYGMGAPKFYQTSQNPKMGKVVDWDVVAPVTPEVCVQIWRDLHWPIVDYWYALQDAAMTAANDGVADVGPTHWERIGDAVWCFLASDRPLIYHGMRVEIDRENGRPGLVFNTIKGRERTYGGKLAENVTQALARDLMAAAIVRLEAAGLPVVLHVHDETVCEVPRAEAEESLKLHESLMCELPAWAEGCPVNVEGFLCERYRK